MKNGWVKQLKLIYLAFWVVFTFSITNSLAQLTDVSETPTQGIFGDSGFHTTTPAETPSQQVFEIGLNSSSGTQTPTQSAYEIGLAPTSLGTPTQSADQAGISQAPPETPAINGGSIVANTVMISGVTKEGDGMLVKVEGNGTSSATNLTSWRLALNNETNTTYTFPDFTLQPKSVVSVHTQKGENTPNDLFGSNFIWNGTRDVELLNSAGTQISKYRLK